MPLRAPLSRSIKNLKVEKARLESETQTAFVKTVSQTRYSPGRYIMRGVLLPVGSHGEPRTRPGRPPPACAQVAPEPRPRHATWKGDADGEDVCGQGRDPRSFLHPYCMMYFYFFGTNLLSGLRRAIGTPQHCPLRGRFLHVSPAVEIPRA